MNRRPSKLSKLCTAGLLWLAACGTHGDDPNNTEAQAAPRNVAEPVTKPTVIRVGAGGEGRAVGIWNTKVVAGGVTVPRGGMGDGDTDFSVARVDMEGKLDESFGDRGIVIVPAPAAELAEILVDNRSNRLLVVGLAAGRIVVTALDYRGAIDRTFGSNGRLELDLGNAPANVTANLYNDKLFVGATVVTESAIGGNSALRIMRLTLNGESDTFFAGGRRLEVGVAQGSFIVDHRGRLFVSGAPANEDQGARPPGRIYGFQADGQPDLGFGEGGSVKTAAPIRLYATDISGRLLGATNWVSSPGFSIHRIMPDGRADASFAEHGATPEANGGEPAVVDIQPWGAGLVATINYEAGSGVFDWYSEGGSLFLTHDFPDEVTAAAAITTGRHIIAGGTVFETAEGLRGHMALWSTEGPAPDGGRPLPSAP